MDRTTQRWLGQTRARRMPSLMWLAASLVCWMGTAGLASEPSAWHVDGMRQRIKLDGSVPEAAASAPDASTCELRLDMKKLSVLTKATLAEEQFRIMAESGGQAVNVPYRFRKATDGDTDSTLRFDVPTAASSVWLYFDGTASGTVSAAGEIGEESNLLAGFLAPDAAQAWEFSKGECVLAAENGAMRLDITPQSRRRDIAVSRTVSLPEGAAGRSAFLEADLESLTRLPWPCEVRITQLDGSGKELPSSVTDPRWSSMAMAPGQKVRLRQPGRIDSRAKNLRVVFRLTAVPQRYDIFGRELAAQEEAMPKLLVSRLELRSGRQLPFPGVNPELFGDGASGKQGDRSFRFSGNTAFFFNLNPQGVWAEKAALCEQEELYWPVGDGTLEAWLNPAWKIGDGETVLFQTFQYDYADQFSVTYIPAKKQLSIRFKDYPAKPTERSDSTVKVVKEKLETAVSTANVEIPAGQWSHLAVCWGAKGGLEVFLNGASVLNDANCSWNPAILTKDNAPQMVMPYMLSLGVGGRSIMGRWPTEETVSFQGLMDNVRLTDGIRYGGAFQPERPSAPDGRTLALFDFDNGYDGTRGVGDRFVSGCVWSACPPLAESLPLETRSAPGMEGTVQTPAVCWQSRDVPDGNDPERLFNRLNYPDVPATADFHAARVSRVETFSLKPGEQRELVCEKPVYMDSVEIACPTSGSPVESPLLVNQGEVDPRSYGDIGQTLDLEKLPDEKARAIRVFNLLLASTDYFMTHQATVTGEDSTARGVEYVALDVLNGYCGFECGPLNNMAVNLFTCAAGCSATQTAGYGHSFQQVFFGNGMNLFDLSAQTFFPARAPRPASLDDLERDPFLFSRVTPPSSPNAYIRKIRRGYWPHVIELPARKSYRLCPGESFRVHWQTTGLFNNLQTDKARVKSESTWSDRTEQAGVNPRTPVGIVSRQFPHLALGEFRFRGAPSANNPAFSRIDPDSFCYRISSPYPILEGTYRALAGAPLPVEISYDNGRTWRSVTPDGEGYYQFGLEVRARSDYLVRVKGDLGRVGEFYAHTVVQMNPRVLTGALKEGANRLTLRADEGGAADIAIRYRVDAKPIMLDGGAYYGAIRGEERQLFLLEPGGTLDVKVTGLGKEPVDVAATTGLKAECDGNTLRIAALPVTAPRIGSVLLGCGERTKRATVLVVAGARLTTARQAILETGARLTEPDETTVMPVVAFDTAGGRCTLPFAPVQAGDYAILSLVRPPKGKRIPSAEGSRLLTLMLSGGKESTIAHQINSASEFYKAHYGRTVSRFKWDFPIKGTYPFKYLSAQALPTTGELKIRCDNPEAELAGVLLVPADNSAFLEELMKCLCLLNYNPWDF